MPESRISEVVTASAQLDAEFAERLDLLQDSGQITPLARRLTEFVLAEIAVELNVRFTEANASPFVSHLAVALTRINRGETGVAPSSVVEEEIRGRTKERAIMSRLVSECERLLDREIPESEVSYMTVHLCAILEDG